MPLRLGHTDFVFTEDNVVAMGDATIDKLIKSISEGAAVENDSGCAPQPVTSAAAIATLRGYVCTLGVRSSARTLVYS